MFLEISTLLVLIAVLLIKYGTWRHTNALNLELSNLTKLYRYNEQRYKMTKQKREASELDETNLNRDRRALDTHLGKLDKQLKAETKKNDALEEQLR